MVKQIGNKWIADVITERGRVRKRFNTKAEAEAYEGLTKVNDVKVSIGSVFQNGCDLFWKGTPNERMAVSHTKFLIGHFGAKNTVTSITTAAIQDLVFELRDETGNAPGTINRKLAALSKLLDHAKSRGVIDEVPTITFLKERKGRIRFLTHDEEQRLFEPMAEHHRAFAVFLLYTGCRFSEALRLQWQDTNGGLVTFWQTKNDVPRSVPLVSRAQASLQYTKGQGWIRPFARIHYDSFHEAWKRAKRIAGLADDSQVVPHVLRHTCASRMVQGGVDIYRVKEWLGHSNISVTERYAHLRPKDLDSAAAVLERG